MHLAVPISSLHLVERPLYFIVSYVFRSLSGSKNISFRGAILRFRAILSYLRLRFRANLGVLRLRFRAFFNFPNLRFRAAKVIIILYFGNTVLTNRKE